MENENLNPDFSLPCTDINVSLVKADRLTSLGSQVMFFITKKLSRIKMQDFCHIMGVRIQSPGCVSDTDAGLLAKTKHRPQVENPRQEL